jgi:hypothetical protein
VHNVLEDPDTFFKTMLEVENPLCPKKLKGVWWMRDNIANERFATFQVGTLPIRLSTYCLLTLLHYCASVVHYWELFFAKDGNWVNPRLGFKTLNTNWSRNATYFGGGLAFAMGTTLADFMNIELSPTENWIRINGGNWCVIPNFNSGAIRQINSLVPVRDTHNLIQHLQQTARNQHGNAGQCNWYLAQTTGNTME